MATLAHRDILPKQTQNHSQFSHRITLGLLLKRPNIALVIVRPFRIDPQNSNNGATYSLIVG